MSEQVIDLRSTWAILRRRTGVLVAAAALGAAGGAATAYVQPPAYTSTSMVLLPSASPGASSSASSHSIDTQVAIAQSQAVLGPAGQAVTPSLSGEQVARLVTVESPTSDVLDITATGTTPAQAEALANAVAKAELDYLKNAANALSDDKKSALNERAATLKGSLDSVNQEIKAAQTRIGGESPTSTAGRADAAALAELTAQQASLVLQLDQIDKESAAAASGDTTAAANATVIQQASPAERTPLVLRMALAGLAGVGLDLFVVAGVIVVAGRRERSLRSRDEIADAVGIPVLASLRSRAPKSVAAWTTLLAAYSPDNVGMWTLRQLLRMLTPGHPGSIVTAAPESQPTHVVVITLAGDLRALATGPQLASFAASTGLRTRLVTAQTHDSGDRLWAACAGIPTEAQPRPGLTVETRPGGRATGDLAVDVVVIDRVRPVLHLPRVEGSAVLLAVTAAGATADELARVALAADDAGHPIDRLLVIDADPLDRTTGRLAPAERAQHVVLPSLMTGSEVAGEATALESRRRLR
ncbi:Wzz/FepE/Etk N-terminal domain-containing protein [Phycicoccus sp. M110.8]|uniref:Wzz/FepE/Etk N-terminal domain-containing protein n=1 Tax=Phycicoccus sp. M110.8 TaxID=3075433 RepID=UPI0028FD92BA|nr:Wzz/FepE/Etk N-terminal domain-containing protein [Phycicoccus sp. M110.8]MDU0313000.1 Wzz/FepE/Etk N-terminal domain-containing protein [Phycicoccus sp. M110.8]